MARPPQGRPSSSNVHLHPTVGTRFALTLSTILLRTCRTTQPCTHGRQAWDSGGNRSQRPARCHRDSSHEKLPGKIRVSYWSSMRSPAAGHLPVQGSFLGGASRDARAGRPLVAVGKPAELVCGGVPRLMPAGTLFQEPSCQEGGGRSRVRPASAQGESARTCPDRSRPPAPRRLL